ncbi:SMI1/KNR4 family protein [Mucilaginibacter pedocola]|uniref:Knr4/Smi1-like domain-containing protein n=1 Tax=Mucilaginibacter pedocola TaxID=1792845 RepID=A0A1S9PCM2_9SPHI|nr:SMI1/KNR4 family protein [Mucilaginibacter pedocola]OOQ58338.1 hypothetical protein BC343_11940 [Mucilaginibacter pedocola]
MGLKNVFELTNHWKRCGVYMPPDEFGLLDHRLRNEGILLPQDFIDLYRVSNGTSDWDDSSITFYGVGGLITMGSRFSLPENHSMQSVVIFADYMDESWWYGVNLNQEGYEIVIISSGDKLNIVARSLDEFIQLYLADSDILSNYI